ncbi:methyltransferase domain-containing protein [Gramella sp. AN32]|uniref:Methyltransferase domain-containing protein n=1 Tax=Christiangramia antarctica TaxID=2058158 RepID=A0ABW5X2W1_9FLAO|nr:methyltransferase domain-containing protein [Gramella sp. AN32]MCM4156808.1 methyltransferase [Gramella sp. AN32]
MFNKHDFKFRSKEAEIMDDFDLQGEELTRTLQDLENINTWLGGNKITIEGIKFLLKDLDKDKKYSIADVGCGNGSVLREIMHWGKRNGYQFEVMGIDANPHAIAIARELSKNEEQISFRELNILGEEFKNLKFDIILCTLTLHHFDDQKIIQILISFIQNSKIGVVVNDLHRNKAAYELFKLFCGVFVKNKIARKDGLISIKRGFKKEDLNKYSAQLKKVKHTIHWKWAFRYQWIMKKKKMNG